MCRLRIPNGIVKHWQLAGLADIGGSLRRRLLATSPRAPICRSARSKPRMRVAVVEAMQDLGSSSRGSGADNIRNVTGTPTAGIDPQELLDTRPFARAVALSHPERSLAYRPAAQIQRRLRRRRIDRRSRGNERHRLSGRRGCGRSGCSCRASTSASCSAASPATSDIARDTGVIARAARSPRVADAIVRVFIDSGDRTNRNKARLKYVLDDWGFDKFLAAVEAKLGAS